MEFNATFLVSAISFIIFTVIMNKIFYKPLENVMDERQSFIDNTKADALNSNNKADEILKDKEDRLSKSALESKRLVAVDVANESSKALTDNAKQKSHDEISSAKLNLQNEVKLSSEELKSKVKDLAEVISSKVLGMDTHIENIDNELVNGMLK